MLTQLSRSLNQGIKVVPIFCALTCAPLFSQVIEEDVLNAEGIRCVHVKPRGICASAIDIQLKEDIVKKVVFTGGCPGNALGINALVKGQKMDDVIKKLSNIPCDKKRTSCPDQLAKSLVLIKAKQPDKFE